MQETVGRYAEELLRTEGVPVQIRVGLNSGEVVVRSIGSDLRMDYTAVGQTTHLAARMEQMARPGATLLTTSTLAFAEGFVRVRSLGPVPVKGLEAPVEVHELTGAEPVRSRLQTAAARGLSRFVGRDTEIDLLRRSLEQAARGRGQVVAVVGEAGVGKSRLFFEFSRSHRLREWLVLESSSVSYGKATPYLPITELLQRYFQIETGDGPQQVRERVLGKVLALDEQLREAIPPLLSLLGALPEDDPFRALGPALRRGRTMGALKQLVLRESERQPLCVIFEDLHWVDAESQAALDLLVESLPGRRVLLLMNYRPEYKDRWAGRTYHRQLRVDPLPAESADELLAALLGDAPPLDSLKALLKDRTGGNPLFVEESVRTLAEAGALAGTRGAYRLTRELGPLDVPATVQALLAARIDRLPPEDKHLLQAAAVIGNDVPLPLLRGMTKLNDEEFQGGLGRLQAGEFLYETRLFPDVEYTFKHALIHDVAYRSLLQDQRRTFHRRVAVLIQAQYQHRIADFTEALAGHSEHGEMWEVAAVHHRLAAVRAKERFAYASGARSCERALEMAEHAGGLGEERLRSSLLLGDLRSLMGDLEGANQAYDGALKLASDAATNHAIASRRHRSGATERNGARIVYYEHGAGAETVFVVNPLLYGLATFQPVLEHLCQDFRVITMDCRGTGASDSLQRPYSIRQHMEDARAVIESAGGGPVIGVGISRGGNLLAQMAVVAPGLLRSLVTVGTSLSWDRPQAHEARTTVERDGIEAGVRFWFQMVYSEPGLDALIDLTVRTRMDLPPDTLLSFFDPDPDQDIRALLPTISVPTLITRGTADRVSSPEDAMDLARSIPNARMYLFAGRCHVPIFTATTEFCEVLRQFTRTGSVPGAAPD
jgi:pimeloyl-ACP methyl ester carboxylesterase